MASDKQLLRHVAAETRLREGEAGVHAFIRAVHRRGAASLEELARDVQLPLPIAAAVRRELEKAGLLIRRGGVRLSESGEIFASDTLELGTHDDLACPSCEGRTIVDPPQTLVEQFTSWLAAAPETRVELDQAPCTPITALRRAALMHDRGALEGRRILILGDDDSIGPALALFARNQLGRDLSHPIAIVELDPGRAAFLRALATQHELPIEVHEHDLRDPLPEALHGRFDVAQTDPPYTLAGAELFLGRAAAGLDPNASGQIFLSYAQRGGADQLDLVDAITKLGFAITGVHRRFNAYRGAAVLGSAGQLFELVHVPGRAVVDDGQFDGNLYTAEVNPRRRIYACAACGVRHELGSDGVPATVEELKQRGCGECGGTVFKRRAGQ